MTRWFSTSRSKQLKSKANFMLCVFDTIWKNKTNKKAKQNLSGEGEMNYKVAWGNLSDRYVRDPNFDDIYISINSLNYVL